MKLYKYYCFNKNSLSALILKKTWLSKVSSFNDPFEFRHRSVLSSEVKDIKGYSELCKVYGSEERAKKKISQEIKKILDLWVASYSESNDDILMWWHYSWGHTWFCLGFDISSDLGRDVTLFNKIKYRDKRSPLELKNIESTRWGLWNTILIKNKRWEYEKEWRQMGFINGKNWGYIDYCMPLVEIIYGSKMNPCDKQVLKEILKFESISHLDCKLDETEYKININPC